MVMGPTHAVSGVAGWLLVAPVIATVTGTAIGPGEMAVASVVASGAAMLPDIDMPSSTVARAFGWPSRLAAGLVALVASGVYEATRTRRDPAGSGGHRTLTHTLAFAVAIGVCVAALCATAGRGATLGVLFVTCGLAVRGLLADWAVRAGWVMATAAGAGVTWVAFMFLAVESYWVLGVAVGVGCVVHLIGDMITRQACPLLWPLPIAGQRWRPIGPPRFLRIRAGGWAEKSVLLPGLSVATAVIVWTTWGEELGAFLFGSGPT